MFAPDKTVERSLEDIPTEHLEAEIEQLAATITASTARWLGLLGEYDARGAWSSWWGVKSLSHWVAWRCGLDQRSAREHVRIARALRELPETAAALASGALSFSKARALTRVADAESEIALLEIARHATAAQLERMLSSYRRISREEAEAAHEGRYLHTHFDEDGRLRISGLLDAEEGALFRNALWSARDALVAAARGEQEPDAGTSARNGRAVLETEYESGSAEPPWARIRDVDALGLVCETALAGSAATLKGGERYQVVVHREADGRNRLADGPALAPETADRLACDAAAVEVVEEDGSPLSVGRRRRTVPAAIRRALEVRDQGCRFPGCNNRARTDAHHICHWSAGGETSVANLVLLCRRHHRALHEGGFTLTRDADGTLRFRSPRGFELEPSPIPPPPLPAPPPAAGNPRPLWTGSGEPARLGDCVQAVISAKENRYFMPGDPRGP